jgi:hypothetical protein
MQNHPLVPSVLPPSFNELLRKVGELALASRASSSIRAYRSDVRDVNEWVSLLLPKSDAAPSVADFWPEAKFRHAGFDLVVAGGVSPSDWGISRKDEIFLASAASAAGCCFCLSSLAIRNAFLEGDLETFDRIVREHSDDAPDAELRARLILRLPRELGGVPEEADRAADQWDPIFYRN